MVESSSPAIFEIASDLAPVAEMPAELATDTVPVEATLNVQPGPYIAVPYDDEREEAEGEESEGGDGDDEESGCEMYAVYELTSDGLEMRAVYHHELPGDLDPYEPVNEWYEWEKVLVESPADAIWLRQWILCDEEVMGEEVPQ
jgi:hypothetical protein